MIDLRQICDDFTTIIWYIVRFFVNRAPGLSSRRFGSAHHAAYAYEKKKPPKPLILATYVFSHWFVCCAVSWPVLCLTVMTLCVGECAVCRETTLQKCRCGRHSELRPCGGDTWCCTEVITSFALDLVEACDCRLTLNLLFCRCSSIIDFITGTMNGIQNISH